MRRVTLLALLLPSFACSGSLDSPPNEGHADGGMGADAGDHSDPPAQNDAGDGARAFLAHTFDVPAGARRGSRETLSPGGFLRREVVSQGVV